MTRIKTSRIKRFVGRLDKVKVARDLLLIVFAMFFAYLAPALSELLNASNWGELNMLFQANSMLPYLLMMPFIFLGLMLFSIHLIDKWEDDKAEKRHQELLMTIKGNRPLIFNRRVIYGNRKHKRYSV